jgi:hypothetical protein
MSCDAACALGTNNSSGDVSMSENDQRPPVWVGHVVLETDRMEDTA